MSVTKHKIRVSIGTLEKNLRKDGAVLRQEYVESMCIELDAPDYITFNIVNVGRSRSESVKKEKG